jgi:hypothetical protein
VKAQLLTTVNVLADCTKGHYSGMLPLHESTYYSSGGGGEEDEGFERHDENVGRRASFGLAEFK